MTAPSPDPAPRWTREQIRAARLAPIGPILQRRGVQLRERDAGNFEAPDYPGLILKHSYWETVYDDNLSPLPKSRPRQIGQSYDAKKVRNSSTSHSGASALGNTPSRSDPEPPAN